MARVIEYNKVIAAGRDQVWRVLADFGGYRAWNPFLRNAVGHAAPGARILIQMQPPGGNPLRFHARIERVEVEARLVWAGHLLSDRLLRGEYSYRLERCGRNETQLIQQARFDGVLASVVPGGLYRRQQEGMRQMADALDEHLRAHSKTAGVRVAGPR